jgi:hypothetical protein
MQPDKPPQPMPDDIRSRQDSTARFATTFQNILHWVFSLIGAVSCWWMACAIYRASCLKQAEVYGIPGNLLFLLEFILIHAGSIPMIAASKEAKSTKIITVSLVSAIYVTFIAAAAVRFHNLKLVLTFAGIMIPRWTGLFTDSDAARRQQIGRSMESILAFIVAIIPTMLGINVVFTDPLIIYFTLMGLLEATSPIRRKSLDQSQRMGCFIGIFTVAAVVVIIVKGIYDSIFH